MGAPLYHLHHSTSQASLLLHLMRGLKPTEKRRVISCTSLCVSLYADKLREALKSSEKYKEVERSRKVERSTPHVSASAVSRASSRDMMTTQEEAASPRRLDIIMMRRIVMRALCLHPSFIVPFTITQMAI